MPCVLVQSHKLRLWFTAISAQQQQDILLLHRVDDDAGMPANNQVFQLFEVGHMEANIV